MKDAMKQAVQDEAQRLFDENGTVTTEGLVDAARPKDSPTHGAFEWDDRKAGESYRLWQARQWLRKIEIRVEPASEPERLVNVPRLVMDDSRAGEYLPVSVVIANPSKLERAIAQARQKLSSAKDALDELVRASEEGGDETRTAVILQMSQATAMWRDALSAMH